MRMVLDPVEVIGSTLVGAYKVRVELDDGNDSVSLHAPLEGSNYGIPHVSLVGDSILNPLDDYFDGSSDVPP